MATAGNLPRRHDLVDPMEFLFVRVAKIRDLPYTLDSYVEVKLGDLHASTCFYTPPEWNQVFAFEKDSIDGSVSNMLVSVKDKKAPSKMFDAFFGCVQFSLIDVPRSMSQESSLALAPQWYRLKGQDGRQLVKGDIMLSMWFGTQEDECLPHAWCSPTTSNDAVAVGHTRSKVYISPTLWYLRVNVVKAQDLNLFSAPPESSNVFVQVDLGAPTPDNKALQDVKQGTLDQNWTLGRHELNLKDVDKRLDNGRVSSKWYNLAMCSSSGEVELLFAGKINARISLDGGYHVMDEPAECCSDFRPSAKKLWNPCIGVLEVGIQKGTNFVAMKSGAKTDAYCVAKYGPKWVRTRTVIGSLSPMWNEQCTWEVYEPSTVITIGVFDNNQLDANSRARGVRDAAMGRVRIRLSTLEDGKVYALSYPLIVLQPSGVKVMGEIHLAVKFSWSFKSQLQKYESYMSPLFPKHHHVFPLSSSQLLILRYQPVLIIAERLSQAEPPLRKEVVYNMLDIRSNMWSKRKTDANFNRVVSLVDDFVASWKWLQDIRTWKRPNATLLFILVCYVMLFYYPKRILPLLICCLVCVVFKRYLNRPRLPCHIDATLSGADVATPEDLEEEFDRFPTQIGGVSLRKRYDRLRSVASNAHRVSNDLASIGEMVLAVFTWRDPRATMIFLMFCVVGFLVTITIPARVIIFIWITYYLRHPRYRGCDLPSASVNFIKRIPSGQGSIL
ncbi:FT-interacting protein 7 [Cajanus cajan]|uniref:C2 domain-containing protein n=1 Tax=Cajanus cajan TaxID=3821 RepID=A0A151TZJ1_CAJCA|nr:FT-interacting protein 7 [Cajanus cajan]KYP72460.1 hypothetical protein KK1_005049 [Cajanus cajan]